MKIIKERQDNGYILVMVLMMLLVLTVIGVAALRTSSLENIVAGNIRILAECGESSDSGIKTSSGSINTLLTHVDPREYAAYVPTGTANELYLELRSSLLPPNTTDTNFDNGDTTADLEFSVGNSDISVDIDKTGKGGEGIANISHNCYSGVGRCDGKREFYYRINSECRDTVLGTRSVTASLYKYIEK